jgi:hypothetical protein
MPARSALFPEIRRAPTLGERTPVSVFLTVGFCFAAELEYMRLNPRAKGWGIGPEKTPGMGLRAEWLLACIQGAVALCFPSVEILKPALRVGRRCL